VPAPAPSARPIVVTAPVNRPKPVASGASRPVSLNAPQDVSRPHIRSRFFGKEPAPDAATPVRPPAEPVLPSPEPPVKAAPSPKPPAETAAASQAARVKAALDELLEELELDDEDDDDAPDRTVAA